MNLLISRLDEQQRRWYAALERLHGGDEQMAQITGLDPKTIRRGRRELAADLSERPAERVRVPGAGRHAEKKRPAARSALLELVEPETAGDPMSEHKWVRSSLRSLSKRLSQAGHAVSAPTVSRLLKAHDYSLRVNAKEKDPRSQHSDRDFQFRYMETQKQSFIASGDPIISARRSGAGGRRPTPSTCMIFCPTPWAVRPMASLMCSATKAPSTLACRRTPQSCPRAWRQARQGVGFAAVGEQAVMANAHKPRNAGPLRDRQKGL